MINPNNAKNYLYKNRTKLYSDGDNIKKNCVYYIYDGKVKITYKLKTNKDFEIIIPSGGFPGIFEIMTDNNVRIMDATVIEDSKICVWDTENFITDLSVIPELGIKCIAFLSSFLRTLNTKIQELGEKQ